MVRAWALALRHRCGHHRRRAALLEATSGLNAAELSVIVRGGAAGQRFLHVVCRPAGRLDGPQAVDGFVGSHLCIEYSGHRAFKWICGTFSGAAFAGHQRRVDRRGGSALSGRMLSPRIGQGNRCLSMAADAGHRGGGCVGMYYSYQVEAGLAHCDRRRAAGVQKSGLAADLLGFAAPGLLFVVGSLLVASRPLALPGGNTAAAHTALLRSRTDEQATLEMSEMEEAARSVEAAPSTGVKVRESLLRRNM